MRSRSVSYASASARSSATIRSKPLPRWTRMPSVDENAAAWNQRAQLDELLRRDVDRAQGRARADELDVAAHPHGLAPGAQDLARRRLDPDESEERLLPLVAPDLQVHVDDVVVRDGDLAQRVRDRERARLVARVEVPDDPHRVAALLDAEGAGLGPARGSSGSRGRTLSRARRRRRSRATRPRGAGCRDSRRRSRPRTRPRGARSPRASRPSGRRPRRRPGAGRSCPRGQRRGRREACAARRTRCRRRR